MNGPVRQATVHEEQATDVRLLREHAIAALRSFEKRVLIYRHAMAAMNDGFVIVANSENHTVVECNAAFARMLGYDTPEEVIGRHPREWDVSMTREDIDATWSDMEEGRPFAPRRYETRHRRRDGSVYDAEVSLSPFCANGDVFGFSVVRDITELKRMRKERDAAELRARLATESAGIGIWEWDAQTDRVENSRQYHAVLGVEPGEIATGEDWISRIHPDDLARFGQEAENALDPRRDGFRIELRVRHGDGSYRWISDSCRVIERDALGKPQRLVGTIRNIDERKKAEHALREREELLSAILDHAPAGVLLIDDETWEVVQFNDHAAAMHGYSRDEFARMTLADCKAKSKPAAMAERREKVRGGGEIVLEDVHRRKDGTTFDVHISANRIEVAGRRYALALWTDISDLKRTEAELGRHRELLSAMFDQVQGAILLIDEKARRIMQFNDHAATMHGYTREEFAGLEITDIRLSPLGDALDEWYREIKKNGMIVLEGVHKRKDGSTFDVQIRSARMNLNGHWGALTIWTDISELKRAQRALGAREEEVRTLVEHSPDGMIRYDRKLRRVYVNAAMRSFIGPVADRLVDRRIRKPVGVAMPEAYMTALRQTMRTGHGRQVEVEHAGPAGDQRWALVNFAPEFDDKGEVVTVLATVRDITELVVQREKIRQLAYNDILTGLANRTGFNERFAKALAECGDTGKQAALLLFDLDRFKDVNDSLGHAAGDELLRQIGLRLSRSMRQGDVLARLGGDEFAVLLPSLKRRNDVQAVVKRVQRALLAPFSLCDREVFTSAAIGIAIFPADGRTTDELSAHADAAMYDAKASGSNGVRFYSSELSEEAELRLALTSDIKQACRNGEFELVYQPKVLLGDGTCVGAEALLRWHHPKHGLVRTDKFIPIAEQTGAIVDIGRWVLHEACRTAVEWNRLAEAPLRVAVNLSSRQFVNNNVANDVYEALLVTDCRPEWLECEITESLILQDDVSVHDALAELARMGITVAIDDFGTGQSALSYLNRFDVDVLKIDRSFVRDMEVDWRKTELVKAFISLAKALGMETVAEGIETGDQARILLRLGCRIGQGFHFSKPLSEARFRTLHVGGRPARSLALRA